MGQKYGIFDANGFPQAFYDDEIHANIPPEAIPLTEEQWLEFIHHQGRRRWDFQKNDVVVYEPPPPPFEELKQRKLQELNAKVRAYIEQFYPEVKQRSDIVDKEYWGSWLVSRNSGAYTVDGVYVSVHQMANRILSGVSDLATELMRFPPEEWQAWGQLVKIALRVAFVQEVKREYHKLKTQIEKAKTEEELDAVNVTFTTPYPKEA